MKTLLAATMVLFAFQAKAGVVCETLEFCRAPEASIASYEVPALTFHVDGPTNWVIGADVWFSSGCQGEPEHTCRGSGFVPYDAPWYLIADIYEQPPAGTNYSIRWIIDGCPDQPCIEGTIAESPDTCSFLGL